MTQLLAAHPHTTPTRRRPHHDRPPTVAVYLPVLPPVQAAQYQSPAHLDDIATWIRHLYRYGLSPTVTFTTAHRGTTTIGLLQNPGTEPQPIHPDDFVLFDLHTLTVMPPAQFRTLYRPLTTTVY